MPLGSGGFHGREQTLARKQVCAGFQRASDTADRNQPRIAHAAARRANGLVDLHVAAASWGVGHRCRFAGGSIKGNHHAPGPQDSASKGCIPLSVSASTDSARTQEWPCADRRTITGTHQSSKICKWTFISSAAENRRTDSRQKTRTPLVAEGCHRLGESPSGSQRARL